MIVGAPGRVADQTVDVFVGEDAQVLVRLQTTGASPNFAALSDLSVSTGNDVTTTVIASNGLGFVGKLPTAPPVPATLRVSVKTYDGKASETNITVSTLTKQLPLTAATSDEAAAQYAIAINGAFAQLSNSVSDSSVELAKDAVAKIEFAASKYPSNATDSEIMSAVNDAAKAAKTIAEKVRASNSVDVIAGDMEKARDSFAAIIPKIKLPN